MPENWKTYKLSQLFDIIGGGTPKTSINEYWNGNIPWLSVVDFNNDQRTVYNTEKKITQLGVEKSSTKILKKGQLIISARGTVGQLAQLGSDMAFNQSCYGLDGKTNLMVNDYGYYLFKHSISKIKSNAHGSVFDTITRNTFENIEAVIPSIKEQKPIASILSALDDKIELNLQMNKTLEEMAMALYKHWFVDFGPFQEGEFVDSELGRIPEGWEVKKISDLVDHTVGGDWGKETEDSNHKVEAKVIRGTDLHNVSNGVFNKVPIRWIKESKFKSRQLRDGDIIIEISGGSTDQPTGRSLFLNNTLINNIGGNIIPTSFCRLIRAKNKPLSYILAVHMKFIYAAGKTWFYQNQSTGISNFQYTFFQNEEKIAIPSDSKILNNFSTIVEPIFNLMYNNENQTLTSLRDTLLPKLISGEIRVKEAERFLEDAL